VVELLDGGRLPSADVLLARFGRGNKRTMLNLRDAAYSRLQAEGRTTDPMAEISAAAAPVLKRLMEVANRQAERVYAERIAMLGKQIETLNLDLGRLAGAEERAEVAEARLDQLTQSFNALKEGLQSLAETRSKAEPKPSAREIEGVLTAVQRLGGLPGREDVYAEMVRDNWTFPAAHKARFRAAAAGYVADTGMEITAKGHAWLKSETRPAKAG
jgi:multidrug efflux pump subunit AcrA (membrane-fusion protein)